MEVEEGKGMSANDDEWALRQLTNKRLAWALRQAHEIRERSWSEDGYAISCSEAAQKACAGDPLWRIVACLLIAGYEDMWTFCGEVLKD